MSYRCEKTGQIDFPEKRPSVKSKIFISSLPNFRPEVSAAQNNNVKFKI